jgi:D-alanine-D-alanine ligase
MSQAEAKRTLRIAVLAGGTSPERDVSLESGANVTRALRERGHHITLIDPRDTSLDNLPADTDIILPMLHGTGAEDGVLQSALNRIGIPWLGSSAEASRLTFDKVATRAVLTRCGLPVPPGVALNRLSSPSMILEAVNSLGYPLVVKPAEQGSSVGVTIVQQPNELAQAVKDVLQWGPRFLLEKFISGREVTVPVIDGIVFPAVEVLPAGSWYDYHAKYTDNQTQYIVNPHNLPGDLNRIVLQACNECGVTAISRTDLRIDFEGRCWILEINTIPGMTSHSLVPMSALSLGISSGELCEQLLLKQLRHIPHTTWQNRGLLRVA